MDESIFNDPIISVDSDSLWFSNFPSIGFPVADALLIPINPARLPGHIIATGAFSDVTVQ